MAVEKEKRKRCAADYLRIIVHHRATPEQIATGVCIGVFIGFSPLFWGQMIAAMLIALIFRASKIAAVLSVWISNPLTFIPIYSFTYWLGSKILLSPVQEAPLKKFLNFCVHHLRLKNLDEVDHITEKIFKLGCDILPAMLIGGLIAAGVISLVCWPLTRSCVRRFRAARRRKICKMENKR